MCCKLNQNYHKPLANTSFYDLYDTIQLLTNLNIKFVSLKKFGELDHFQSDFIGLEWFDFKPVTAEKKIDGTMREFDCQTLYVSQLILLPLLILYFLTCFESDSKMFCLFICSDITEQSMSL